MPDPKVTDEQLAAVTDWYLSQPTLFQPKDAIEAQLSRYRPTPSRRIARTELVPDDE